MDLAGELGPIYSWWHRPGRRRGLRRRDGGGMPRRNTVREERPNRTGRDAEIVGDAVFRPGPSGPPGKGTQHPVAGIRPTGDQGYTEKMADIADQLVMKWARLNPGDPVDICTG